MLDLRDSAVHSPVHKLRNVSCCPVTSRQIPPYPALRHFEFQVIVNELFSGQIGKFCNAHSEVNQTGFEFILEFFNYFQVFFENIESE